MDLRIPSSPLTATHAASAARRAVAPRPAAEDGTGSAGFSTALRGALQSVSAAQDQSTALQREVQLENPSVSLEQTMVAIQKAQIGFQSVVHVRNRMVQAYSDIMNMQV
ncbi:flagellar hook-basal body complex protein FliE [Xylophilus sp.]|uniref:flagellar hook-basal body complex protein FliE n=1 Tax=Xylophilus sp. TaxID=2653893 RepID=UPI0013BE70F0|nr:flagellar hook-basal body complex protein FliE [Xylophilus sp.]KAF1047628.1 MAG: Flagellar hook-basal body complex protein FliE [Xylophilus sp.]